MVPVGDTSGWGSSSPTACEPQPHTSTHTHSKTAPSPKPPTLLAKAELGCEGRHWAAPSQTLLMGTMCQSPTPGTGRGPRP